MNISFAMTTREFLSGKKTCTRRRWKQVTADKYRKDTLHVGWSRIPFLPGATRLGVIRATRDAYQERLGDMPEADLEAEGGMCQTVDQFIAFINGEPDELVWVARFKIVEYLTGAIPDKEKKP